MARWTKKDRKRVADIIGRIAAHHAGGLVEVSQKLGIKTRQNAQNWRIRGRVPLVHIHALIALAPKDMTVLPSQLHPNGHHLEPQA